MYDTILDNISREKSELQQQLQAMEKLRSSQGADAPTFLELMPEILEDVHLALSAVDRSVQERHDLIASVVASVYVKDKKVIVNFKSPVDNKELSLTVSGVDLKASSRSKLRPSTLTIEAI